ncbi:hypothetical protein ZIOFF_013554 [Zingiber officinale]|uniref:Cyclic nucleotide-binding domain-containing protein n=1 Tax=Zingiber officinale TaxID=94328 RepID=A0A8J5LQC8_ZINOF|nr:hypothetical protein ZIOFF_013554 [Zingiber officinale]
MVMAAPGSSCFHSDRVEGSVYARLGHGRLRLGHNKNDNATAPVRENAAQMSIGAGRRWRDAAQRDLGISATTKRRTEEEISGDQRGAVRLGHCEMRAGVGLSFWRSGGGSSSRALSRRKEDRAEAKRSFGVAGTTGKEGEKGWDYMAKVFNMPLAMMCDIEAEISRDDSHYSLSTGILPSLGARSNRRVKLRRFIVSPYDRRYRSGVLFPLPLLGRTPFFSVGDCELWNLLWMESLWGFFSCSLPSFYIGTLALVDNIVNAFFAIDIILTFFLAYLDRTTYLLVDDPKLIAWKYLTSWFVLDVASTIPSELARKLLPHKLRSYGFFNMLRLWRLRRVSALFARLEKDRHFNYFWVRCAKLICVTLFAVHCAGCFYYLLCKFMELAELEDMQRDTIQVATGFAQRNQLPERLQEQMISHLSLKFRTDSEGLQQQETLDALPKAIRSSITHYLFYSLVQSVYLFHGVSNDLLFQLVSEMKAEYYPPRDDVILQNEAPTDFYILVTGTAVKESFHSRILFFHIT